MKHFILSAKIALPIVLIALFCVTGFVTAEQTPQTADKGIFISYRGELIHDQKISCVWDIQLSEKAETGKYTLNGKKYDIKEIFTDVKFQPVNAKSGDKFELRFIRINDPTLLTKENYPMLARIVCDSLMESFSPSAVTPKSPAEKQPDKLLKLIEKAGFGEDADSFTVFFVSFDQLSVSNRYMIVSVHHKVNMLVGYADDSKFKTAKSEFTLGSNAGQLFQLVYANIADEKGNLKEEDIAYFAETLVNVAEPPDSAGKIDKYQYFESQIRKSLPLPSKHLFEVNTHKEAQQSGRPGKGDPGMKPAMPAPDTTTIIFKLNRQAGDEQITDYFSTGVLPQEYEQKRKGIPPMREGEIAILTLEESTNKNISDQASIIRIVAASLADSFSPVDLGPDATWNMRYVHFVEILPDSVFGEKPSGTKVLYKSAFKK